MAEKNVVSWNIMVFAYAENGMIDKALEVFDEMPMKDAIALNLVVHGYFRSRGALVAFNVYKRLNSALIVVSQVELDAVLGSAVDMDGKCDDLNNACKVLDGTMEPKEFSLSTLITKFVKCGRYDEARRIFDSRHDPGVVLWNSMIVGYVEEALELFEMMMRNGVNPDSSTLATILSACTFLGAHRNMV